MGDISSHDGDGTLDAAVTNSVADHHPGLAYTFGAHTYSGTPTVDVDGDGTPDGIRIDFDGSGQLDAVAWDSDGDGTGDTILMSSHHDGHHDTAYYDHGDRGSWSTAEDVSMTLRLPGDAEAHAATLSYSLASPPPRRRPTAVLRTPISTAKARMTASRSTSTGRATRTQSAGIPTVTARSTRSWCPATTTSGTHRAPLQNGSSG